MDGRDRREGVAGHVSRLGQVELVEEVVGGESRGSERREPGDDGSLRSEM
ncbi:hypothetical protein [Haloplanus salilacus]